jgi:hypothetical protein
MFYRNAFRILQAVSFIAFIVLSSTAVAKDRSAAPTESQRGSQKLSGIDVNLEQPSGTKVMSTKTDERGSFIFSNVPPGSYKLRIGCEQPEQKPGQKCYAEMRILITEKSTGVITGSIRKEGT